MIMNKFHRNWAGWTHGANGANGANGAYGANGAHGADGTYGAFRAYGAALLFIISLMGLYGCSSSSEEMMPETKSSVPVEVMGCVAGFEDVAKGTRGWIPPYLPNDNENRYGFFDNPDQSISVFFTQDDVAPEEEFFFKSSGNWRVSKTDLKNETYYLYGYAPHPSDNSVIASISSSSTPGDNSSYSSGAVLTLQYLPAITPNDFCVVIGAKNGYGNGYTASGDYEITGLKRGDFTYTATTTGEGSGGNYVYLLFDHLYAALRVRMTVHPEYAALRTIKLRKLYLSTSDASGTTKKYTTASITLQKTTDGSNPIQSVVFTPTGDELAEDSIFIDPVGMTIPSNNEHSEYIGHFMPLGITTLTLTSVYDVYDKNPVCDNNGDPVLDENGEPVYNLVRKDCKATNTIVLRNQFSGQTEALRGRRYNINLTIRPTYLYVMSDPDLNNPTMVVE